MGIVVSAMVIETIISQKLKKNMIWCYVIKNLLADWEMMNMIRMEEMAEIVPVMVGTMMPALVMNNVLDQSAVSSSLLIFVSTFKSILSLVIGRLSQILRCCQWLVGWWSFFFYSSSRDSCTKVPLLSMKSVGSFHYAHPSNTQAVHQKTNGDWHLLSLTLASLVLKSI